MARTEHEVFELDGVEVKLSSPSKVYFPQCGVTKGQLARFYVDCAETVLNHLRERPTVLKRYAGGIEAEPFYQKRVPAKRPEWLQTAVVHVPVRSRRPRSSCRSTPRTSCGRSRWATSTSTRTRSAAPTSSTRTSCASTSIPTPGATWDTRPARSR